MLKSQVPWDDFLNKKRNISHCDSSLIRKQQSSAKTIFLEKITSTLVLFINETITSTHFSHLCACFSAQSFITHKNEFLSQLYILNSLKASHLMVGLVPHSSSSFKTELLCVGLSALFMHPVTLTLTHIHVQPGCCT